MAPEKTTEYSGVWVFIEQGGGEPARVSLELLCEGRAIADKLGVRLTGIALGKNVSECGQGLIHHGADSVFVSDHPVTWDYRTEVYTSILAEQVLKRKPEIFLAGGTYTGRDLVPRMAARLNTGCTSDCIELHVEEETRLLVATKPFLGRNLMADIVCPFKRPQIVTIRPGVLDLKTPDMKRKGEIVRLEIDEKEKDVRVKVVETVGSASTGERLEDAEKVVVGGMGVGDQEGFEMLRELALLLGAKLGSTSLPVDAGWVSEDHKIGQTGKTIRPRLYLGCGVSGAVQHSAGMIKSDLIVAINNDPEADIFRFSDYGIIGDLKEVVPALIKILKGP